MNAVFRQFIIEVTMPQDDIQRMSKRRLERELKKLREEIATIKKKNIIPFATMDDEELGTLRDGADAELRKRKVIELTHSVEKALLAQNQSPSPDNMIGLGFNICLDRFVAPLEEMLIPLARLERARAELSQIIEIAALQGRLDTLEIRKAVENQFSLLSHYLAVTDPHNRKLGVEVHETSGYYLDFTYYQQLYSAAVDFVNGKRGSTSHLLNLVRSKTTPMRKTALAAFKMKKPEHATVDYDEIYKQVEELRKTMSQTKAFDTLAEHGGYGVTRDTIERYYKRAKKKREMQGEG